MPVAAGLHYYLHEAGDVIRPPLVLVHGAGGDRLSWPPELRRLPDLRVYTLDLPGHGKTEGPGLQSIEDYARSVVAFLNVLGLSRAVVAGHCMGGAVALSLALDYPDRVAGIGLISTGPCLPVASPILENAANPATLPLALKVWQEMSFHPQALAPLREAAFKRLAAIRQTLLHGDLLACDRFDVTERLDTIRTPALVVCGMDDKLTPVRFSETLSSRIPGAALQTVDEAAHMLVQEQPRRLAKLLSVFLMTIPYQPGM